MGYPELASRAKQILAGLPPGYFTSYGQSPEDAQTLHASTGTVQESQVFQEKLSVLCFCVADQGDLYQCTGISLASLSASAS